MKTILMLFLTVILLITQVPVFAEETNMMTGGWQTDITIEDMMNAKNALERILSGDSDLEMTKVMARQIVNGTHYAILCRTDRCWEVIYLSVPKEENPAILREDVLVSISDRPVCGGMGPIWNNAVLMKNDDQVIDETIRNFVKNEGNCNPEDIDYTIIGGQIVAGVNYLVLLTIPPTDELPASWKLITIYADLDGNGTVEAVQDVILFDI